MEENRPEDIRSSRQKLIMLIMIAFVPIFIAYAAFFYFPDWAPDGTTNQGELISPPMPAEQLTPALTEFGTWVLLQPTGTRCDEACTELLYLSRQVVTGLGKDTSRIQRVVLPEGVLAPEFAALLNEEHPDVAVRPGDHAPLAAIVTERPVLLLMDPNGNVMMYYLLDKAGKPMLKDLKHLLRVSNIG